MMQAGVQQQPQQPPVVEPLPVAPPQYMLIPQQPPLAVIPPMQPGISMMPQQQVMPQTQQHAMQQSPQHPQQPQVQGDDVRSLWVGDLQYWMDENYLKCCFAATMAVMSAKVIRNKQTGQPEGYGFVEFVSHGAADRALQSFNGTLMPRSEQIFRLNWASFGLGDRRDSGPDHSIFVGDLAADVTDALLLETFKSRYPSVKGAKVVTDVNTGRSKGYGFVRFGDDSEKNLAMTEMNGVYCSSRPMRISTATPKKALATQQLGQKVPFQVPAFGASPFQAVDNDPANTTIFVGGLDQNVGDEDLRKVFSQFGDITYIKIPTGKGCGFVQFTTRASAEEALQKVNGSVIGQQPVRLSWGRSPGNKQRLIPAPWGQPQFDPSQWNGGYYAYNQGYDAYGYIAPPLDPAFAYANYPAYGAYPQQVS